MSTTDITTDPKTVVREFWESWGRGDLDATWDQYVGDILIHPSSGYEFTRQSWLEAEKALHGAFADVDIEVLDQVAEGDKVATRWSATARTHTGEFFGVRATGRTAVLTGTTVDRVADGKLVEHWAEVGVPQFLQQLTA
jgi:predicted ester cyclase